MLEVLGSIPDSPHYIKMEGNMKVVMKITGIDGKITVAVPNIRWGHPVNKELAKEMAIETLRTIREADVDIIEII